MTYTKICIGISGKDVSCSIKIPDDRQYCAVYHEHYQALINNGYTKETIELLNRDVFVVKNICQMFFLQIIIQCVIYVEI
jgi:hypothetical protein